MKGLFLLIFLSFNLIGFTKEDSHSDSIPIKLEKGIIIYQYSDSALSIVQGLLIFKAEDYIKLSNLMNPTAKDSSLDIYYAKLKDTLQYALKNQINVGKLFTRINDNDLKIFPKNSILMDLFLSNKVILLNKEKGAYQKIKYFHRKKMGINYIYERRTKKIFFISAESIVEFKSLNFFQRVWFGICRLIS